MISSKSESITTEAIEPATESVAPPPATRLSWFRAKRAAQEAQAERAKSGPVPTQPEPERQRALHRDVTTEREVERSRASDVTTEREVARLLPSGVAEPDMERFLPSDVAEPDTERFLPSGVAEAGHELAPPAFDAPPEASALAPLTAAELLPLPTHVSSEEPARFAATRVFALLALTALFAAVGRGMIAAYYAATDAFVTPIILSPDSDLVLPSKLSLAHLLGERQTWQMRGAAAQQALEVAVRGQAKLQQLRDATAKALAWSDLMSSTLQGSSEKDLSALEQQKQLLEQHLVDQRAYVAEMEHNLAAGLARKSDVLREQAQVSQLQVELLDNQRAQLASAALHRQNSLEQEALRGLHQGLRTPQMLQQQNQLVRIELELSKLQGDKSTRQDELRVASEEMQKLDELIGEMKRRPVFRAVESRQNVAFLPYAQSDGVGENAAVYQCRVLGMFACEHVGSVLDVLPGEVNMQDPWGTPTRGQYALLDLDDPQAARAKALRLRARERDLTGLVAAWWAARK